MCDFESIAYFLFVTAGITEEDLSFCLKGTRMKLGANGSVCVSLCVCVCVCACVMFVSL